MDKSKKFIALFLVFSVLALSGSLYAKERRGAKLIITKKDGGQIKGELIVVKVKQKSLLLLDTEGKDESVDIKNIKVIKIVKKSGFWNGFLIGGVVGAIIATPHREQDRFFPVGVKIACAGIIFGLIGGVAGAFAGKDETIQIEGKSPRWIEFYLKKLRKKARRVYE